MKVTEKLTFSECDEYVSDYLITIKLEVTEGMGLVLTKGVYRV